MYGWWAGLSISDAADLLGCSHITHLSVYREFPSCYNDSNIKLCDNIHYPAEAGFLIIMKKKNLWDEQRIYTKDVQLTNL